MTPLLSGSIEEPALSLYLAAPSRKQLGRESQVGFVRATPGPAGTGQDVALIALDVLQTVYCGSNVLSAVLRGDDGRRWLSASQRW